MNSIRRRLAARLMISITLLFCAAGLLIYFTAKKILKADFDASLLTKAKTVSSFVSMKNGKVNIDWDDFPSALMGKKKIVDLVQITDEKGNALGGDSRLPHLQVPGSTKTVYGNFVMEGGRSYRVISYSFYPLEDFDDEPSHDFIKQKSPLLTLLVASERSSLDRTLNRISIILLIFLAAASVACWGVIVISIKDGLSPLDEISAIVAKIDVSSLKNRILKKDIPQELVPVVEKLNRLFERLEESFAREKRFSSDVSHELRTPIAELRSLAEVMLRSESMSLPIREAFEDVIAAAHQMEKLVEALLAIARNEQDSPAGPFETFDLVSLVKSVLSQSNSELSLKKLQIELNVPSIMLISSNQRLMEIILSNLIANAIEYSPADTMIEIQGKTSIDGSSYLQIENSTSNLQADDLPHLFERFWRKDKVRGNTTHFGLGLSLCNAICKRLNLSLRADFSGADRVRFRLERIAAS